MSLFTEHEITVRYYDWTDSNTTKITQVDLDEGAYTNILAFIVRIGDTDAMIEGDVLGEYRANVRHTTCKRGGLIYDVTNGEVYQIVRKPRYSTLFNRYHLSLKHAKTIV